MNRAVARAVVKHTDDPYLRTTVRSVIGYIAEDGNKWKGPWRKTYDDARRDAREHNAAELVKPPV